MRGREGIAPVTRIEWATWPVNGWTCPNCGQIRYVSLVHHCPTLRRLSPMGGGPKP